jgi:hypothetical protein
MPSPELGSVVWPEAIDMLPSLTEKIAIIFSNREIRYRTPEERRMLSILVIEHFAIIRGGACILDPTMATCWKSHQEPITGPSDLHFHHRPGTKKLYHIRDYQHCIRPSVRLRNLETYLCEVLKCDPICWRHHVSYHALKAQGRCQLSKSILFCRPLKKTIQSFRHSRRSCR